jgi:hypothetical protein
MQQSGTLTAILPCNNLDVSERFYNRLGFTRLASENRQQNAQDEYRILSNGKDGNLHLTKAMEGWLVPGSNPFGLYLNIEEVDELAMAFRSELRGRSGPEDKPWGMYEFALSDPDETLVRIGWPSRLR